MAYILFPTALWGQVFQGEQNLPIPPNAGSGATVGITVSNANVTGVGTLGGCRTLQRVLINVLHTWTGDVAIFLISPAGTILELTSGNGGAGNNWSNTEFRDDAPTNIVFGGPPYTGSFRPEGRQQSLTPPFSNVPALETFTLAGTFAGENADGNWQLYVNDFVFADIGEILNWELEFSTSSSALDVTLDASATVACPGTPVDLSVVGVIPPGATYSWSTGAATPSISVNPTTPTLYRVTVTDGGCEVELEQLIEPAPALDLGADEEICSGESISLSSNGSGPVTWSTGQTAATINVAPTTTTTYTATANFGSCTVTDQITVNVLPPPNVAAGPDQSICAGESVVLTATGDGPFTWSNGQTGANITVNPTTSTTYTVRVGSGSCQSTDFQTVTVTAQPTLDLGGDQVYCAGEATTLTAFGSYTNVVWNTGATGPTIPLHTTGTQVYTATASNGNCSVSESVTITITPAPQVTAGPDQSICAGESVVLTATGDGPFFWSDGQTGASITVSPTTSTTYTVRVGSGSCQSTADQAVTVTAQPTLDLGGDQVYCAGEATTLTALGSYTDVVWNTGATGPTIPLHTTGTQVYSATASNGNCSVSESVTITITPAPQVTAGPDQSICAGESVVLTATGDGPFTWSNGQTGASITVNPTTSTTYTVRVGSGSCQSTDAQAVTVTAQPTLDLGGDQVYCAGEATTLTALGSYTNVVWNTGATGPTIPLHTTGTQVYSATASNGNCSVSESVTITITPAPQVTAGPDQSICAGESVVLTATGDGPFTWSNGQTGASITVSPTTSTTYTVRVGSGNCRSTDEQTVTVTAPPTLDLGGNQVYCAGEATTLTAFGSYTDVVWNTGATGPTISLHTAGTEEYTATASNGNCTVSETVLITITPVPQVTAGPDQNICSGETAVLTATGDGPFFWSNGQTGASITVSPTTSTTYTVRVGSGNCRSTDELAVTVSPQPTLDLGGDQVYCAGEATTLTAVGDFTSILWGDGQTTPTIALQTEGTQTYTATASTGNCSVSASTTITVLDVVSADAGPDQSLCAGDTLALTASGSGPFTWSTGFTGETILVNPLRDTSFVVVAGAGNCQVSDTVAVEVRPLPTLDLGGDQVYCAGEATTLTAVGDFTDILWGDGQTTPTIPLQTEGTQTFTATASTGNCSVSATSTITVLAVVSADAGPDQSLCAGDTLTLTASGSGPFTWSTGFTGETILVNPLRDTSFVVVAGAGNCQVSDTVAVQVRPLPEVALGPDVSVCAGEEITLASQFPAAAYDWSDGSSASTLTLRPVAGGDFALTVTSAAGCSAADTLRVAVRAPTINLGPDRVICPGDSLVLTAPIAEAYAWSTGSQERVLRLAPTADQTVSLLATIEGCTASDTIQVQVTNDFVLSFGSNPNLCPGDSITLRPQGTGPFRWSTGEVAEEITVRPAASAFISASVGTGNCAVTDSVFLTVLPAATADLGADQSLCLGETTDLIPQGDGVAFAWSNGAATSTLTVQADTSVSIGVVVTNAAGCTASDTINLDVTVPRLSLTPVPEICPGDTITLRAADAESYAWESGEITPAIRVSPTATTVYRVVGFTETCSVTDSVRVTVRPRASVFAGEDRSICPGTSTLLTASGDGPFRWSDGTVGPELEVMPQTAQTYFAVAGAGNCQDTAFVRVDLFAEVSAELGADREICRGDSVALRAQTGTAGFSWADGDFAAERLVMPTETTTYRILATENGCTASDSVTVVVNDLPTLGLLETDCAPDNLSYSVTLAVAGGAPPYLVNNAAVTDTVVLGGIVSGTPFTALLTDANNCATTLIDVVDCGCTEIFLRAPERGCNGSLESRDLTALLPPGAPPGTWSVVNPDANGRPFVSGASLSLAGTTAGQYVLQYLPDGAALECLPDYRVVIEIEDPPSAGVQSTVEERCAASAESLDLFAELLGAAAGGSWEAASENTVNNPAVDLSSGSFLLADQPPGEYRFRYRAPEGAGCPGGVAEVVIRLVGIEVDGVALPPDCADACSGTILVNAPDPTWRYALDGGVPAAETRFGGLCAGTYALRAENDLGCTATLELRIPQVNTPEIVVLGNTSLLLGDSTVLRLLSNAPADSVVWSPAVNCLDPACQTVSVRPQETTIYSLRFISAFGCPADTVVQVEVDERVGVYVPTAFSPNGDGINDLLTVYAGTAILSVENFRLFDRWGGQLVNFPQIPLGDASFGWDGNTNDGRPLPPAVYVYQLSFTRLDGSKELVTGEVTLVR
ncbi:gliding motility-associated C-terminal domain-containing protein [Neolewinella lacunae]|uniref:Gliding motility-associated C-terminal domain-containing protein n=1 Tax=Neolewinella lacunae TaxID=1517758 RepID=A0A923T6T8_9BACT|nr:proprotein convertase P-domain-containing protein [Neolewinella lacunae]MBC6992936.1 gliding motility-associated C-terminal domain-containing protein [Neolewinella lacunae]MDN3633700.1 gliding motility-associated C-terminal domain-containing protein [Neolewinella lacunae]